ncbi:aldo/keto reductase [Arthrobacter oryzae]|uniref:aldo/keto reductase n=1 Tax=Arthrobacter oryzae TaxID=409290 RepID=UPI003CC90EC6
MNHSTRKFQQQNRAANKALVDFIAELARSRESTPGQIALAWLLAQNPSIVPIPGTRRTPRIEENASSTTVALSADNLHDLDSLARRLGVAGDRYNPHHLALVGR